MNLEDKSLKIKLKDPIACVLKEEEIWDFGFLYSELIY